MKFVQPIRSKEKIEQMKEELRKRGTRDYIMFLVCINTGLRIRDIVKLKSNDIRDESNNMRTHITIIEIKTKKVKKFPICNDLYIELEKYTRFMRIGEYLFKSQGRINCPITTTQAYRIIKSCANNIKLKDVGTHKK